jgi:hypothetical protein
VGNLKKVPSKYSFWRNLWCKFVTGHMWGTDALGMNRFCANCGRWEVLLSEDWEFCRDAKHFGELYGRLSGINKT